MPDTEAGKSLVNSQVWVGVARDLAKEIDAIEAEAREQAREEWDPEMAVVAAMNHGEGVAAERARIRAAVERMELEDVGCGDECLWKLRDAVLAIIEGEKG